MSPVKRLLSSVWSFVRSLFAFLAFPRRSSDLPTVARTPKDALARVQSRLRPILLTPRSIARPPTYYAQRAQSRPAPPSDAQKTDPELGLSTAGEHGTSATSLRGGTPDTSLSVLPLTPPDRCYLAPMPSATDCPYAEPWPANAALDRDKPRLQGSPLKVAITETMVGPIGSPPPGHWSPVDLWTSTPCKNDRPVPDPALSPFDPPSHTHVEPSPPLDDITSALVSRSRSSVKPYDDTSDSDPSVDAPPVATTQERPDSIHERYRAHIRPTRFKNHPYPQFHYPNAYACKWRRHGARVPGKCNANANRAYPRSQSHMDLRATEWYDADAYVPSPVPALSPPLCESGTEDEDESDEEPLGRLRERLARRSAARSLGVWTRIDMDMGTNTAPFVSPRTRRMSDGCLLAIPESTPTRIGMDPRLSLALDAGKCGGKDWLDLLALEFSSERKEPPDSAVPVIPPTVIDVATNVDGV